MTIKKMISFIVIVLFIGSGLIVWTLISKHPLHPLPEKLFPLPDFTLMERNGKSVSLADLRGKVWIVNFIFTHCPDVCPIQNAKIAQLQKSFSQEKDLRLVSISVDPDRDTPEVLRQYADQFEADPERWFFLTGEKETIYELAINGFKLPVQPFIITDEEGAEEDADEESSDQQSQRSSPSSDKSLLSGIESWFDTLGNWLTPSVTFAHEQHNQSGVSFFHSSRFILVDRQGTIRGYYESKEAQQMKKLQQDLRLLLDESHLTGNTLGALSAIQGASFNLFLLKFGN